MKVEITQKTITLTKKEKEVIENALALLEDIFGEVSEILEEEDWPSYETLFEWIIESKYITTSCPESVVFETEKGE